MRPKVPKLLVRLYPLLTSICSFHSRLKRHLAYQSSSKTLLPRPNLCSFKRFIRRQFLKRMRHWEAQLTATLGKKSDSKDMLSQASKSITGSPRLRRKVCKWLISQRLELARHKSAVFPTKTLRREQSQVLRAMVPLIRFKSKDQAPLIQCTLWSNAKQPTRRSQSAHRILRRAWVASLGRARISRVDRLVAAGRSAIKPPLATTLSTKPFRLTCTASKTQLRKN